ncbi:MULTISPECIES: aldo/keto reductase [Acidithrix]|uniref:L-glyceraldehyde 3-phosphate reductase n=1 Tax=Acidithrix ferrooxidans TaxID=1280514 RepID=A0A0D8HIH8_9ACTN|nr:MULTISPECIES: aldo/keto reductase [Acidithrix]KJF17738.1 L-glyceraldehyde 3-phosphate reductase [Acidithrix ferrooxidans]
MEYRRLGRSGVKVSALSLGSWVTFGTAVDTDLAVATMKVAREAGVNFFDNAEAYAGGQSEELMGKALRKLKWRRNSYLVSSKYFWGLNDGVNERNTLNRKYLLDAIDGSLERLGLSFIDIAYCHRPDPETPIEETVRAMNDIIDRGKALYWGVSEWSAAEIRNAYEIADRYGFHKPVTEQPQYNLFHRKRVEVEYEEIFRDFKMGTTTWSPLASGLLSGKYVNGIPEGSRGALSGYEWLTPSLTDPSKNNVVGELAKLAAEIGATPSQLAIAWCLLNPNVSTVITGATSIAQVNENMESIKVLSSLTPEIAQRIQAIVASVAN